MTTPDPIRALLTEVADELDHNRQCLLDDRSLTHPLADRARAALARWGHPATPPAPLEGEVGELMEWLERQAAKWEIIDREAGLTSSLVAGNFTRAATLLAQLSAAAPAVVPMAVSERIPGPEDCDAEGRCWMFSKVESDWRLIDAGNPGVPHLKYCFSHWLPAHAIPLPAPQGGEVV